MAKDEFVSFLAGRGVSAKGAETAWELLGEEAESASAEDLEGALREICLSLVSLEDGL